MRNVVRRAFMCSLSHGGECGVLGCTTQRNTLGMPIIIKDGIPRARTPRCSRIVVAAAGMQKTRPLLPAFARSAHGCTALLASASQRSGEWPPCNLPAWPGVACAAFAFPVCTRACLAGPGCCISICMHAAAPAAAHVPCRLSLVGQPIAIRKVRAVLLSYFPSACPPAASASILAVSSSFSFCAFSLASCSCFSLTARLRSAVSLASARSS